MGENDEIVLIDEIHTPDSSRFWQLASYEDRFKKGEEPQYFDKEFLRLWFKEHCDPYKDEKLPDAPAELVDELSRRYIQMYEQITGEKFVCGEKPIGLADLLRLLCHTDNHCPLGKARLLTKLEPHERSDPHPRLCRVRHLPLVWRAHNKVMEEPRFVQRKM